MARTGPDGGYDLAVVGAGPAGSALAHRATLAGLAVALIDPDPFRPWSQTFGTFVDELPSWLAPTCFAARSATVTAYTPRRRVLMRPYAVLDNTALRAALELPGVRIVTEAATRCETRAVHLKGGSVIAARAVIDATGRAAPVPGARPAPRQRAFGVIGTLDPGTRAETVLMDWRTPLTDPGPPTFGYRVPLGGGRFLVEETFLAGTAPPIDALQRRWAQRGAPPGFRGDPLSGPVEIVDFPLTDTAGPPWACTHGRALRFGARGGLMHPATGYSVAASLASADVVVDALIRGHDPRSALWPRRARRVHRLRELGLSVLVGLGPEDTARFFDAFFSLDAPAQRAYLSSRDDLVGVSRAMASTFTAVDRTGRRQIASGVRAHAQEQIRRALR